MAPRRNRTTRFAAPLGQGFALKRNDGSSHDRLLPPAPVPAALPTARQLESAPEPLFVTSPGSPPNLPPLFEGDPLYAPPVTRSVRVFSLAKGAGTHMECEDAVAVSADERCVALCDGTSTTNLPRSWASILTQHWVRYPFDDTPSPEALGAWIEAPRAAWRRWVRETWLPALNARYRQLGAPSLPADRAEEVVRGGASATIVGVRLSVSPNGPTWASVALGDSCLFVVEPRGGAHALRQSIPLKASREFNDRPPNLSTRDAGLAVAAARCVTAHGICPPGCLLFAASDALAKWALAAVEQGRDPWRQLDAMRTPHEFEAFVRQQRDAGQLDDDDTTLVIIPVDQVLA